MNTESKFIEFEDVKRIWAVGSIHSNYESFTSIKEHILLNFTKGDSLIILGNVIGLGSKAKDTISSIVELRFKLMAKFLLHPNQIVFLRGSQEEMFLKLIQLQTAPNPKDILKWMFDHGVDKTIQSYGFSKNEVQDIVSQGTLSISKWTSKLNETLSRNEGHKEYFSNLKHAAFSRSKKILFVNRGVDISRPLSAQNDCFWWGYQNLSKLNKPYNTFVRIVRGYQSKNIDSIENSRQNIVCTLFDPPFNNIKILGGIFAENGEILDLFESK